MRESGYAKSTYCTYGTNAFSDCGIEEMSEKKNPGLMRAFGQRSNRDSVLSECGDVVSRVS